MGKIIQLKENGELGDWCGRSKPALSPSADESGLSWEIFDTFPEEQSQGGIPLFRGPQASRPWVQEVRKLLYPSHLLN